MRRTNRKVTLIVRITTKISRTNAGLLMKKKSTYGYVVGIVEFTGIDFIYDMLMTFQHSLTCLHIMPMVALNLLSHVNIYDTYIHTCNRINQPNKQQISSRSPFIVFLPYLTPFSQS